MLSDIHMKLQRRHAAEHQKKTICLGNRNTFFNKRKKNPLCIRFFFSHPLTHTNLGSKLLFGMIGNNQLKMLHYKGSNSACNAWESINQGQSTGPTLAQHTHTHKNTPLTCPMQLVTTNHTQLDSILLDNTLQQDLL